MVDDPYELRGLDDLRPEPTNPRTITKEARSGLKYSVEEFGDLSGITWNHQTGTLVCGHQRVSVLKEAGAKYTEEDGHPWLKLPGGDRFKIRTVDWPLEKHQAAMAVANSEEIAGDWTNDVAAIVNNAKDFGIDVGELRLDLLADKFTPPTDPYEEWSGMPEYVSEDKNSHRDIIIHFHDEQAVEQFAKLVGQDISPKTKFIWYPAAVIEKYADKVYDNESNSDG